MTTNPLRLDAFLPFRLSVTSNLVSARIAEVYESLFGLSIPEWRVIAVVAELGCMTQQAICARTRMDKVTVSRAAIALVDRKLVLRHPNSADKRSHLLSLSATGQSLYDNVAPKALETEADIFKGLTKDEQDQLMAVLCRIDDSLTSGGGLDAPRGFEPR